MQTRRALPVSLWLCALAALAWGGLVGSAMAAETTQLAAGTHKIFQWRPFLAPFHAVVLHFPIGFLTMAVILEIYRHFHPSTELKRVTVLVLWLSLISGLIAAGFGILRAASGGYEAKALGLHRWLGMSIPFATLLTLGFQRVAYRNEHRLGWISGYRALLAVTCGLLVVAGHYGGNLTHGSTYLTENAPEFVREFLEEEPAMPAKTASTPAGALDERQRFYVERVLPVFQAKCVRCHGPEKQKGGYRLDSSEFAFKSGTSEKLAIVPGDPWKSHLVHLVTLPPGHDDVMPPEGKEPLTPEEIGVIVHWVRLGAAFAEPVTTPPATETKPPEARP